ncbi:MAG: GIY-YIG nuclease family protein, partial [Clostridia bacterium]|nr:GIY-YIG nuclease family protein [Clostridia bacterium]
MYYVYRFIDAEGNIIYVGKSKQDLLSRFKGHQHLPDECYRQTLKIEYIECQTEADMSIKEIYYINKYRNTKAFWNIQDIATIPASVEFSDTWHMYMGELPKFFCNSINYIEGYSEKVEKEIRLTRNGEVDRRVCNKKEGVSSAVDALDVSEINRIINYLIDEIEKAEIPSQKQIRFRNLVMFVLGINLPLKINKFLELKYHHLL